LASTVVDWLPDGDLLFANPSSIHSSGKKTKRYINESRKFLFKTFDLDESYRLFFHSGASEGINTLVKGFAQNHYARGEKINFVHAEVDHSCVYNLRDELELYGHKVTTFGVCPSGDFDEEGLIQKVKSLKGPTLVNFTWVNNETGVVWDLSYLEKLKKETNCLIHVDAVQAIGKIPNWKELSLFADAYTFSGHKFGALKGIGFSFVREDFQFCSMIRGGGQQEGMRSGTENTYGIYSLKLALEELIERENFDQLVQAKSLIENELVELLSNKGRVVARDAKNRNGNTIYMIIPGSKADILITAFDLAKMDVSSGSACSSGAVLPSRVLMSMGVDEEEAKSAIRLSFSYELTLEDANTYLPKISTIVKRFL